MAGFTCVMSSVSLGVECCTSVVVVLGMVCGWAVVQQLGTATALSRLLGFRHINVLKFLNTNVVATFLGGGGNEFEDVRKGDT